MNIQASHAKRPEVEHRSKEAQSALVHERVTLCCRLARLLRYALTGITCPGLRFGDRSRLQRVLAQLESDIGLARTVLSTSETGTGGTQKQAQGTTKAASSGEV